MIDSRIIDKLRAGCVIPAHPLALQRDNRIDERCQRALTRYYLASGAGGLAVGVHTTQFAIHEPGIGLYRPVLELAIETARQFSLSPGRAEPIMIAGVVGDTPDAIDEAHLARELGYHLGLLSLTALRGKPVSELIEHCRQVAGAIPVMGFYLQETISGMVLPAEFWQKLVALPGVLAIKIAPFNRYQTLDVLEAVAHSGRAGDIALYTGNDDNIILDLLTRYEFNVRGRAVPLEIVAHIETIRRSAAQVPADLLTLAGQMTLANKAIFDADNRFAGCIPGISYVLKRQGLLKDLRTLDPEEQLSPGQADKIDRIITGYPHLTDDEFVKENLHKWLEL
ncbi:MAG: dihydrodipicolinate synthase family protein [Planctomycetota bacterium]|jgi:dihydrodipicolinate synthase/N-acetylneuraminate lyase